MPNRTDLPAETALRRATAAVYIAFIGAGFAFASWASRIPQVRRHLHLTPGALGLVLLCIAIGSLIAIPSAGHLVRRFGEANTVAVFSLVLCTGLVAVAIGYNIGPVAVGGGLLLFGFGNGAWDVAMNVHGAAVERELERSIMSRFHAGYSIGTVAGAGIGAGLVALGLPVTVHLLIVAVLTAVVVPLSARRGFLPHVAEVVTDAEPRRSSLAAWREPRTILIGVFVLCAAFAEGTAQDWLGVGVVDGYNASATVATSTLALFLAAMTIGRWFGPALLDRFGRVLVLRACVAAALVGLMLVVFGHSLAAAMAGAAVWGLGASLGFPTGISAAADDPRHAAARVSVAASIAYTAFLAGPPVIGFVADHLGVLHGLIVAAGLMVVAGLLCGVCAPLKVSDSDES